jgi:hypothetical protein
VNIGGDLLPKGPVANHVPAPGRQSEQDLHLRRTFTPRGKKVHSQSVSARAACGVPEEVLVVEHQASRDGRSGQIRKADP